MNFCKWQDDQMDKVDTFEGAILGLNEAAAENSRQIAENRDLIMENLQRIDEVSSKLDALLNHFDVPYKPPTGFAKK